MEFTALVFDFDGLLMDTESTLFDCWRHEWRRHGLELDVEGFFADHGGDANEQRYADLARAVGPSYDRAASHARRLAYRDELHTRLELAPGIREWLDRATELGLPLAVASSSPGAWVRGHLGRVGVLDRFAVMACGDEVARHKPDPSVYQLALRRLGRPAAEVLAFEDTPHGVAAANAAGLHSVAVPNAFATPDRFGSADLVLAGAAQMTLDDVLRRVRGRSRGPRHRQRQPPTGPGILEP